MAFGFLNESAYLRWHSYGVTMVNGGEPLSRFAATAGLAVAGGKKLELREIGLWYRHFRL